MQLVHDRIRAGQVVLMCTQSCGQLECGLCIATCTHIDITAWKEV